MSVVITIGRQYGSAGLDIGQKISLELNLPYYDKELVEMAAERSNISHEALKKVDERATSSFLYSLVNGNYSGRGVGGAMHYEMPINDKLFIAQAEIIKEIAHKSSCVIVGRCADYILEQEEGVDVLSVFVYGPLDYRVRRVMDRYDISQAKAREKVIKTDKQRRTYYDYYTNNDWGVMGNYDLCLNTQKLGIDGAADMVINYVRNKIK